MKNAILFLLPPLRRGSSCLSILNLTERPRLCKCNKSMPPSNTSLISSCAVDQRKWSIWNQSNGKTANPARGNPIEKILIKTNMLYHVPGMDDYRIDDEMQMRLYNRRG
ncbi:hypothetical protein F4777DRAFT_290405 [Nemania sp. FL0916]|nr:hypothetical protein F4777DRAFT_290405 [Nemania sp. FL0916]